MLRIACCIALLLATTATAQNPVPRVGDKCPNGTYRSGDYCKPYPSKEKKDQSIITKSGKDCPNGFYSSGNYCKQYPSQSSKEAIPRDTGDSCPGGWYKYGGYCVKHGE